MRLVYNRFNRSICPNCLGYFAWLKDVYLKVNSMKQYRDSITKWFAAVAVAIALVGSIVLPANAYIIEPGETFEGPIVPQFEISAVSCEPPEVGVYSFTVSSRPMPLTQPNFVPCGSPGAIDSIYPPGGVARDRVQIENLGTVPLNVDPVFL